MMIPKPLHTFLITGNACKLMSLLRALNPLLISSLVIPLHPSAPDNQYISRFKLDVLFFGNGFYIRDGDFVPGCDGVFDVVFGGIGDVVD
jgi:hypothetical protein